jgi:L-ribulose-5-phosphate 4-epimerase
MLESLREEVYEANLELVRRGLAIYTFGNASGIARDQGLVAIKPSGVPYDTLRPQDLVIVDLEGRIVEGTLRPSSDVDTHLVLYRAFDSIGGVVHTHSRYATAWAQAGLEIPCFGTTHADYFYGPVPVTANLSRSQIESKYEENTGQVIVERFRELDPKQVPGVLVACHGPFCWGANATKAAQTAALLEEIALLAYRTVELNGSARPISPHLLDRHFLRKHGPGATYGQS